MSKRLASANERRLHAELADAIEESLADPGVDVIGKVVAALRRFAATGTLAPPPRHRNYRLDALLLVMYDVRRKQDGMSHEEAVAALAEMEGVAERTIERTLMRARKRAAAT
jgi:hypothetical protein